MNAFDLPQGAMLEQQVVYRQELFRVHHARQTRDASVVQAEAEPTILDFKPLSESIRDFHDDRRLLSYHASGLLMLFDLEKPVVGPHLRSMDIEAAKSSAAMTVNEAVRIYVGGLLRGRRSLKIPEAETFNTARDYFDRLRQGLHTPMDKRMTLPRLINQEQRFFSQRGVAEYVGSTALARQFIEGHLVFLLDRVLPKPAK